MLPYTKKLNRKGSGFTIIEVMIVLAIAALILLIVFLAVPALQRSQRNNARKSESSRVAAAVVDFTSTNSGNLPTTQAHCNSLVTSVGTMAQYALNTTCPVPTGAAWPASLASNNLYIATGPVTTASPTAIAEVMILDEQTTCGNGSPGTTWTPAAGSAKNAALLYSVESGSTYVWNCVNPQ